MGETTCLDPQREVPTNGEAETPVSSERFRSVRHKQASASEGVKEHDQEASLLCGETSVHKSSLLLCSSTLLGKQHSLDVRQHTSLSDGNASEKLIELLVIPERTSTNTPFG